MNSVEQLVRLALEGNAEAQERLFSTELDRSVRLACLITGDWAAAEDAVQEALISAYRNLHALKDETRFTQWFTRIVVNKARTMRRRNARVLPMEELPAIGGPNDARAAQPEGGAILRERNDLLMSAIQTLNDKLRIPIILKYYSDLTEVAIAQAMDLPSTTIKSRLHIARLKIKKYLQSRGFNAQDLVVDSPTNDHAPKGGMWE